jgi:hypothetical protein
MDGPKWSWITVWPYKPEIEKAFSPKVYYSFLIWAINSLTNLKSPIVLEKNKCYRAIEILKIALLWPYFQKVRPYYLFTD